MVVTDPPPQYIRIAREPDTLVDTYHLRYVWRARDFRSNGEMLALMGPDMAQAWAAWVRERRYAEEFAEYGLASTEAGAELTSAQDAINARRNDAIDAMRYAMRYATTTAFMGHDEPLMSRADPVNPLPPPPEPEPPTVGPHRRKMNIKKKSGV